MRKKRRRIDLSSLNGVLPLYKPVGPTSHDMVNWLRKKLGTKKIGHSGTLDPFAEGVLVMGVGKGTRILEYLKDQQKEYIMRFRLGLLTDTYDIEGEVISDDSDYKIDEPILLKTLENFRGRIKQVPPQYSARKFQGKKLYEYAREGKVISMPPREIDIFSLEYLGTEGRDVTIKATVSPGTYLRSLAFDIGIEMGTHAAAITLKRTKNGGFSSDDCIIVPGNYRESDEGVNYDWAAYVKGLSDSLNIFRKAVVKDDFIKYILNGNPVKPSWLEAYDEEAMKGETVRILDVQNHLLALGMTQRKASFFKTLSENDRDESIIKLKKVFGESYV
jgi:tRNA pseudouridine55 synthase